MICFVAQSKQRKYTHKLYTSLTSYPHVLLCYTS